MSRAGSHHEWLSTAWTDIDERSLGVKVGDHRGQAVFEALVVLVAARAWAHLWESSFAEITGQTDSMAVIGAHGKARSKSPAINMIVRELALDAAVSPNGYSLTLKHLPGKANLLADPLSRLMEPGSGATVPVALRNTARREVAVRDERWWRTGSGPEVVEELEAGDMAEHGPHGPDGATS